MNSASRQTGRRMVGAMRILAGVLFLPGAGAAFAQNGGALTVNATIQGSIDLTFDNDPNYPYMNSPKTAAAAFTWATVRRYGASCGTSVGVWYICMSFEVIVGRSNVNSGSYTLNAALSGTDAYTWMIGPDETASVQLETTPKEVARNRIYDFGHIYSLIIGIPDTVSSGSAIDNQIQFSAVAN